MARAYWNLCLWLGGAVLLLVLLFTLGALVWSAVVFLRSLPLPR